MTLTKYTYSIVTDTLNGKINATILIQEIKISDIVPIIDYIIMNGDVLDIYFLTALSSEEEVILNTIVENHKGNSVPLQGIWEYQTLVDPTLHALNEAGSLGWEVYSTSGVVYQMKRRVL